MDPQWHSQVDELMTSWQAIRLQHARTFGALERALKEHELGVSEYDVLERLVSSGGDEQRRMNEIGAALCLSQSALSRVVARLERDGLVHRDMCPSDRRGTMVCVTPAGRERYEAARPAHRAALEESLTENVSSA